MKKKHRHLNWLRTPFTHTHIRTHIHKDERFFKLLTMVVKSDNLFDLHKHEIFQCYTLNIILILWKIVCVSNKHAYRRHTYIKKICINHLSMTSCLRDQIMLISILSVLFSTTA